MLRFAVTIFLGAFLLFQVQPLVAKAILPWFGGSPSVWTTCMLFFQVLLLGGYCYAHLLRHRLLHVALLAAAVATLPILPHESWKPAGGEDPTVRILLCLLATIGLPYFLLSSTGPLVQKWFAAARPGRSPYRLYALSNVGSVAALVTFPFLFEPVFTGAAMAWTWSALFVAFAALSGLLAWKAPAVSKTGVEREPVRALRVAGWLGLAALPSVMLLAVTNVLCQDIAVVPFLWVAPLTVYLLTFILCFDSDRWYRRGVFAPLLGVLAPFALFVSYLVESNVHNAWTSLGAQVALFSALLFVCGMVCHGELASRRPGAGRLTLFYLCVAAGGALGGLFVAVVAPLVFTSYVELWLGAAACTVAAFFALPRRPVVRWGLSAAMTAGLFAAITLHVTATEANVISRSRGFFGRLRVYETKRLERQGRRGRPRVVTTRAIAHGHTLHGVQFMDAVRARRPTTYYAPRSGVGIAMRFLRARGRGPLRVGVVGLGAGTLAAYAEKGDTFRFYEIQSEVIDAAERDFTYLADARGRGATVTTVPGDGRIRLEREEPRRYDLLVVDAFSSDAIPRHLLTRECGRIYQKHLREDGLLAFHITNRFLDLLPVVRALADDAGRRWTLLECRGSSEREILNSTWVVVTSDRGFLSADVAPPRAAAPVLWTDDFSSLWHVLR